MKQIKEINTDIRGEGRHQAGKKIFNKNGSLVYSIEPFIGTTTDCLYNEDGRQTKCTIMSVNTDSVKEYITEYENGEYRISIDGKVRYMIRKERDDLAVTQFGDNKGCINYIIARHNSIIRVEYPNIRILDETDEYVLERVYNMSGTRLLFEKRVYKDTGRCIDFELNVLHPSAKRGTRLCSCNYIPCGTFSDVSSIDMDILPKGKPENAVGGIFDRLYTSTVDEDGDLVKLEIKYPNGVIETREYIYYQ